MTCFHLMCSWIIHLIQTMVYKWNWESGLCCFTPLSPIFHLYRGSQLYWWRKKKYWR